MDERRIRRAIVRLVKSGRVERQSPRGPVRRVTQRTQPAASRSPSPVRSAQHQRSPNHYERQRVEQQAAEQLRARQIAEHEQRLDAAERQRVRRLEEDERQRGYRPRPGAQRARGRPDLREVVEAASGSWPAQPEHPAAQQDDPARVADAIVSELRRRTRAARSQQPLPTAPQAAQTAPPSTRWIVEHGRRGRGFDTHIAPDHGFRREGNAPVWDFEGDGLE